MSLTVALQSAVSSLQANQLALDVTSNNVANANTKGYTRKRLEQETRILNNRGAGVFTTNITREVDESLSRQLRNETSGLAAVRIRNQFYDQMQNLFGTLTNDSSIAATITGFSNTLQALSIKPEGVSQRTDVVNSAVNLTRQLDNMGRQLQTLRRDADVQIGESVDIINSQLAVIENLNKNISQNMALNRPASALQDQRDQALNKLSEQIGINYFTRGNGDVVIFTGGGGRVLLDHITHPLSVTSVSSMDAAITHADGGVPGVMLDGVDITNEISEGRIGGLVEMRDTRLPDLVAELDQLTGSLRDEINAIQNDGTAFPAPNSLTGSHTFSASDTLVTQGNLRIAVVDSTGAYANDGSGNPDFADIDLSALTTAVGGTLTVQNVVDAINGGVIAGFSGVAGANASLVNGKLVIRATNPTMGVIVDGTNIDGSLGINGSVNASGVTTGGDIVTFPTPTVALATSGISQAAGAQLQALLTNGDLTFNVETTAGAPGQLQLAANANFAFGPVGGGAGSALGLAVNTASGDLTAGGTVEIALDSSGDGLADTVIGTITFGAATLAGATTGGAQGSLAIQGIDISRDTAVTVAGNTVGFNQFFGLNDFFTTGTNYDVYSSAPQTSGSTPLGLSGSLSFSGGFAGSPVGISYASGDSLAAIAATINADSNLQSANISAAVVTEGSKARLRIIDNDGNNFSLTDSGTFLANLGVATDTTGIVEDLAVRQSLVDNPGLVARGALDNSTAPAIGAAAITAGDNAVVQRMANKLTENLSFVAAGGLGPMSTTLPGFGEAILALNSVEATNVSSTLSFKKTLVQNLDTKLANSSGVNIDEELAKVILFQNAYNASARVISVLSDMLDTLTNLGR